MKDKTTTTRRLESFDELLLVDMRRRSSSPTIVQRSKQSVSLTPSYHIPLANLCAVKPLPFLKFVRLLFHFLMIQASLVYPELGFNL